MRVINQFRLRDFWIDHPRSENSLRGWYQLISSHDWDDPEALQATFPSVQIHENLAAFDIRGSSFFVIASLDYHRGRVFVRDVMMYNEFRAADWKQLSGAAGEDQKSSDRSYMDLVTTLPLRPIQDDDLLRQASLLADALIAKGNRSQDEQDYLDVLALILIDYERQHVPVPPVSGAEVLRVLITEHRLSQAELIPLLGGKAKVNPVLQGTRPLDLRQVSRASRYFRLPPETFVDPDDYLEEPVSPRRSRASSGSTS